MVAVVGYCSLKGCYFVVLEVLQLGVCGAMVPGGSQDYWVVGMIVDDGMVWMVLVGKC